ncbi:MAG: polysaccharide biosynthesis C-terminal domain-containing protein [Oscillospiraceae bacterium]|nr:polysaccharide biosynthesis C-terminal domain-containing protein [Oscillospiraceae bacterium]
MSRKLPIFYSALLLTGVNLLLRLVGTSFQVYLSGRIGAAGIGLLQLTMSVGSLAMVAGMGGIRTATMYLTAEELGKGKARHVAPVLSACLLYSIAFSGAIAGALYHFAPWLADNWIGDIRIVDSLRLFAAFLPTVCLCGVMTGYFTAANRIGTLAAVEVAEQLCSMVITMGALAFWAGQDPGKACLCVVLGSSLGACLTLVCLVVLRLRERASTDARIPIRSRLFQTAFPLAIADDLRTGINTAENLMVPKRLALNTATADPLAAFGLVSGMVFPVIMFPAAILFGLNELLIPELARCSAAGSGKRIHHLVRKSLRVALVYGLACGGLLFLLADALCQSLYGSLDAAKFMRWYALLVPMLYCDSVTDAMTKGLGQQKVCVRYNILTSALDVAFLYILLPRYGMEGYFVSFLATHLLNFCLSLRRLLKITGQAIPFHIPALSASAMLFAIFAASFLAVPAQRAGAYLLILGCQLFLMKILTRADILWVMGLLRNG